MNDALEIIEDAEQFSFRGLKYLFIWAGMTLFGLKALDLKLHYALIYGASSAKFIYWGDNLPDIPARTM